MLGIRRHAHLPACLNEVEELRRAGGDRRLGDEQRDCGCDGLGLSRKMQRADPGQIGLAEVEDDAAAHERGRQVAFVIAGDDDQRNAAAAGDAAPGISDFEAQPSKDLEQVVRQVGIRLVDLVDQDHRGGQSDRRVVVSAEQARVSRGLLVERFPDHRRPHIGEEVGIELLQVGVLQAAQLIDVPQQRRDFSP